MTISKNAAELIVDKLNQPAFLSMKKEDSVPSLSWAQRTYTTDLTGKRTEHGPMFFLSWVGPQTLKEYDYLFLPLPDGSEIAMAGGEFFRGGSYVIDAKDGQLTLVDAGQDPLS
ncbi:MAG: hypothetical protein ABSC22_15430 [Roseiarcus sp.]